MLKERWNDRAGGFHPVSAPDFLPRQQLREVQSHRLQAVVGRAWDKVALFRERMQARGLTPDSIAGIGDIAALPFTTKADLRDTYPFGLFASPMDEVVRLHASSGTTGKPIVVAYTREDIEVWTEAMARTFAACGLHRGDILQNAFGYGLFTGGMGTHYGAEAIGAAVIPVSGGNTERQIMLMRDFGVTAVCATPSFFVHLVEKAGEMGVDLRDLPLRTGVFGAEPWTDGMRERIQAETGIEAFDIYGLSEITGPGVATECACHDGLHVLEDHFFPEIIDPATGAALPDGEEGELVLTTLSKRAMPMIRYRTRDITAILTAPCGCGRTMRRIRRISRRSDDMFIIRGVNVFPSQVEAALLAVEGTVPHYQIVLTREHGLDRMTVEVEVTPEVFSDTVRAMEELRARIGHAIEHVLGIRVGLRLVGPHSIPRSEGKARDRQAPRLRQEPAMKISQLSVFLENRPHSLLEPLQALAAAGIDLSGIALADSEQFGILRLVLRDWARARGLLQSGGWAVTVTDMVAIHVEDQPGGLVRILEVLAAAGADIEYMYGFFVRRSGRVAMLFRFARPELAIAALEAAGITMLGEDALY